MNQRVSLRHECRSARAARVLGALGLALAGCGRLSYSSRGDATGDLAVDAPALDERESGRTEAEAGIDASDASTDAAREASADALDAGDVLDASDASDAADVRDASDALDASDAADVLAMGDVVDALDAVDAPRCEAGAAPTSVTVEIPPRRTFRTGEALRIALRFGEPIRVAPGRRADVRATIHMQDRSATVTATMGTGSAPDEIAFEYTIAPDDFDADSIEVSFVVPDGSIEDAAGCPRSFPLGPEERRAGDATLVHAGVACPQHYVYVPPSADYALPQGFCVSAYEMAPGASPTSAPEVSLGRAPATGTSRANDVAACEALGPGFHLMTNAEWQAMARNVERTNDNWSGLEPGVGRLNVGNIGPETGGVPLDQDPCGTLGMMTRYPACQDRSNASAWEHKRTHVLSNGGIVWDLGGNNGEWMSDTPTRTPRAYACALSGEEQRLYGPARTYAPCPGPTAPEGDAFGIGYAEGSGGDALQRGSGGNIEGGAFYATRGIFYSNTNAFWTGGNALPGGPSFRCAYVPTTEPVAAPTMDPVKITVRAGSSVFMRVVGNAPAGLAWDFLSDPYPPALTPEGDGVRFTAGGRGTTYRVRARAGDGRVFVGAVTVGAPGV